MNAHRHRTNNCCARPCRIWDAVPAEVPDKPVCISATSTTPDYARAVDLKIMGAVHSAFSHACNTLVVGADYSHHRNAGQAHEAFQVRPWPRPTTTTPALLPPSMPNHLVVHNNEARVRCNRSLMKWGRRFDKCILQVDPAAILQGDDPKSHHCPPRPGGSEYDVAGSRR